MTRTCVSILAALLTVGVTFTGCGKKTTHSAPATDLPVAEAQASQEAPAIEPIAWAYDKPANPPIEGSPSEMLGSFSFAASGTSLGQESRGACREVVRKLEGRGDYRLVVVGFADGFVEKGNAERLGLKRAETTRAHLSTLGIPTDRVQVTSFGAAYSTAKDYEKIKMSRERKIEIWILD